MNGRCFSGRCPTAVLVLLAILGLLLPTAASADSWPLATATKCWSVGGGFFMKARITPAGDGFYDTRYIIVANKTIHNVGSGTAYLRGTSVFWETAEAGKDATSMYVSLNYLVFNKDTLVGQTKGIGHDKNFADGSLDTEYGAGALTLKPMACTALWQ